MISINTDVVQLTLTNMLSQSVKEANIASRNISTGLKVNGPSDNPSIWYIAEKNNISLRGANVAITNAESGANFADASANALADMTDVLTELSDYLNSHSYSGNYQTNRQQQNAVNGYISQINNIIESQNINGTDLFVLRTIDDTTNDDNVTFYIGTDCYDNSSIDVSRALNIATTTSGGDPVISLDVRSSSSSYETAKANVETMLQNVQAKAAYDGTMSAIFTSAVNNINTKVISLTANKTILTSADIAEETVKLSEAQIKENTISSLMVQNINALASITAKLINGLT